MAFVFKDERFQSDDKEVSGSLCLAPQSCEVKKNIVPFNSSVRRTYDTKNEKEQPPTEFSKEYKYIDRKKEIFYQRLKLVKAQRKETLQSEPIFKEKMTNQVGPGSYDSYRYENTQASSKIAYSSLKTPEILQNPIAIKKSSLSRKPRTYSDETQIDSRIMVQKNGTNRRVGPGSYNPVVLSQKQGVLNWGKMKTRHLFTDELNKKVNLTVGPGSYNPDHIPQIKYKEKGLSSFKQPSTSRKSQNSKLALESLPGPGYYSPKIDFKPFKSKKKKFEMLSVLAPRFAINFDNYTIVGPGSYNISKEIVSCDVKNAKIGNMEFGEFQSRFTGNKNVDNPGPGTYIHKIDLIKPSYNKKCKFIDQTRRFEDNIEDVKEAVPPKKIQLSFGSEGEQIKIYKFKAKRRKSVPFLSNVIRRNFEAPSDKLPAVGDYNPRIHEISYCLDNKGHNISKDTRFLYKQNRFKDEKQDFERNKENTDFMINLPNLLLRDAPQPKIRPKTKSRNPGGILKSNTKRFEDNKRVAYRFYGDRLEWNKKSFNTNF